MASDDPKVTVPFEFDDNDKKAREKWDDLLGSHHLHYFWYNIFHEYEDTPNDSEIGFKDYIYLIRRYLTMLRGSCWPNKL